MEQYRQVNCSENKMKSMMNDHVTWSIVLKIKEIGLTEIERSNYSDVKEWFRDKGISIHMVIDEHGSYRPIVWKTYTEPKETGVASSMMYAQNLTKEAMDEAVNLAIHYFNKQNREE